jgi:hypothetical protein
MQIRRGERSPPLTREVDLPWNARQGRSSGSRRKRATASSPARTVPTCSSTTRPSRGTASAPWNRESRWSSTSWTEPKASSDRLEELVERVDHEEHVLEAVDLERLRDHRVQREGAPVAPIAERVGRIPRRADQPAAVHLHRPRSRTSPNSTVNQKRRAICGGLLLGARPSAPSRRSAAGSRRRPDPRAAARGRRRRGRCPARGGSRAAPAAGR